MRQEGLAIGVVRARQVGDEDRVVADPLHASPVELVVGDLDHAPGAAALDHRGEHRGQGLGPRGRRPHRAGRHAVGPAERADQAEPDATGLEDRPQEEPRGRPAVGPRHADDVQPLGRVAGQRMAEPRVRGPGVGDDHLEPPRLGARPLDHDPRRPPFQRLPDERMPVVPGPPDRDEDLARLEPSAVGRAARDLPVGAPPKWAPGSRRRRLTEGIPRCGSRSTNQRTIGSRLHASRDPPAIPMPGRLAVPRQAAAFLARARKKAMPDSHPGR